MISFERLPERGDIPQPRSNHAATFIPSTKEFIVFGGLNRINYNDLHIYNLITKQWRKIEFNSCDETPCPRGGASLTFIRDKQIALLFGGWDSTENQLNDLYSLDIKTWKWTKIQSLDRDGWNVCRPSPRSFHSACEGIAGELLIFGGYSQYALESDVWILNTDTWHWRLLPIDPSHDTPPGRHRSAAVLQLDTGYLWIYGGSQYASDWHADVWRLKVYYTRVDVPSQETSADRKTSNTLKHNDDVDLCYRWEQIFTDEEGMQEGFPGIRRSTYASLITERHFALFGGYDGDGHFSDVWLFDTKTLMWHCLEKNHPYDKPIDGSKTQIPIRRGAHSMTLIDDNSVVMFGGYSTVKQETLQDIWKLEFFCPCSTFKHEINNLYNVRLKE